MRSASEELGMRPGDARLMMQRLAVLALRYGVAVGSSAAALVLALALVPWAEGSPFPLFLAAVMLSAWYGGLGPGLLATVVGAVASSYYFLAPTHSLGVATAGGAVRLLVFGLVALLISSLNAALHEARRRAEAARAAAEAATAELRAIQTVTDAALAHLQLDDLLSQLLARIHEVLQADVVGILLVTDDGRELVASAGVGLEEEVSQGLRIPMGRGIGGRVAAQREPLVVEDLAMVEVASTVLQQKGVRSLVSVPLMVEGRVLGVLQVGTLPRRRFGDDEVRLLRLVADRIALAIAQARLYETERRARAEAQQALRVRDEFLASASHELRTPLSHIKGFVSTLRQTDVEWDAETRQDFLAEIDRETDRLAKMIGDLLDMSRLESGELDRMERISTRPAELVAGGLDRVRGLVVGNSIEIDVPTDLPEVLADPSQLERVVANLVENAAKYGRPGTPIRLAAAVDGGELELQVEDEGPGIPAGEEERIFEKFYRLRTDGPTVPGTGLGLTISRQIVQAHGGRIRAETHPRGARFVVRLPLKPHGRGSAP